MNGGRTGPAPLLDSVISGAAMEPANERRDDLQGGTGYTVHPVVRNGVRSRGAG